MSALNTQTGAAPTTSGALSPELAQIANNPHAMAQLAQMLQAHNAAPVGLAPPIGAPPQAAASAWAAPQPAAAGPWAQQAPPPPQGQWGAPPQQAPTGAMPPAQGVLISITVVLPNGLEMPISLIFDASVANNPQAIINVAMALGNAGAAVKAYPPRQQNGGGGGYGNRYGGGGGGGGYNGGGGGYGGGGGGGRWWGGRR